MIFNMSDLIKTQGQAINVQLQQKGKDGQLTKINPATLAELVKLQSGETLEAKVASIGSEISHIEGELDVEAGKVAILEGEMSQAKSDIQGIKIKDGEQDATLEQLQEKDTNLESSISANSQAIQSEVARATREEGAIRQELVGAKAELQQGINDVKALITDKNSNTRVFTNMEEFHGALSSMTPKVGDLVFVIDVKKAFIYKGEGAVAVLASIAVPTGWVLFDEISTELDLADYLTKADAQSIYRAKADRIVEGDLDDTLQGKINTKADLSHVTNEIKRVEDLNTATKVKVEENANAISGLESRFGAVESKVTEHTQKVADLESKVEATEEALLGCVYFTVIG